MKRFYLYGALLVVSSTIVGCGGEKRLKTVEVSAKVFVDDQPFGPAMVSLSLPEANSKTPNASGTVAKDGTTTLRTYSDSKGIVPGAYVANLLPDPLAMNQVPPVKPVNVEVKTAGEKIDIKFTAIPNAVPGMTPLTIDNSAPATTTLSSPLK